MCDMPHAILLLEGTLRMLLVLRAHVSNYKDAAASTAEARKMDNVLSVPSRRRMDCGMSHLILKDGATFSYIWY